jgi:hypothetical protein
MPRYNPIDIGLPLQARLSDLAALKWDAAGVVADFFLPTDDASLLRVSFNRPCIIRLVDEMALSTEADTPVEGTVSEHFAYRIEDAAFARLQSDTWKVATGPVTHYRLITGWACMDILSSATPSFAVVPRLETRCTSRKNLADRAETRLERIPSQRLRR